jgi:hypothetical protein
MTSFALTPNQLLLKDSVEKTMHLRWGVTAVKGARDGLQGVQGAGQLFHQLGVTPQMLQRLGVHHMTAKSFLTGAQSQNWRGLMNVSKQISTNFVGANSAAGRLLESFRSGLGSMSEKFPQLSSAAQNAASTVKGAAIGGAGRVGGAIKAAKASSFFGSIMKTGSSLFSSVAKIAGPILRPLKAVGNFMRMIPGLNLIFAAADTFKAVKTLFDPSKSWGEKLAAVGKAALSIGAALPIPGASLLGGVRGAWAIGDVVHSAVKN